jgi:hypothetical protein
MLSEKNKIQIGAFYCNGAHRCWCKIEFCCTGAAPAGAKKLCAPVLVSVQW